MNIQEAVDAVGGIVLKVFLIDERHVSMDWESTWGWRYTKIEKENLFYPQKHTLSVYFIPICLFLFNFDFMAMTFSLSLDFDLVWVQ